MKALRGLLVLLVACVPSWALAAEIDGVGIGRSVP